MIFTAAALCTLLSFVSYGASHPPRAPPSYQGGDPDQNDGPNVWTTSGLLQGKINKHHPSVEEFLGVPFAEPPLGDLRFAPPRALKAAKDKKLNVTHEPPQCFQFSSYPTIIDSLEPGYHSSSSQSEDCLKLSIWAPASSSRSARQEKKLPVLIFIYGGGFVQGGINETFQIPTRWVARAQDLIVVKPAYRLNIFGFPNAEGLQEFNPGMLDVRMAVEWVRDNIEAFGGDSSRITLWGQSAGSVLSDAYQYAYVADPIISSAILTSGSAHTPTIGWQTPDVTQSNFTYIAEQLNCTSTDPAARLSCMRAVPGHELANVAATQANITSNNITFHPRVDNVTVFSNYTQRGLAGQIANIPAIYGNNRNEGERKLAPPAPNTSAPNQTLAEAYTLVTFECPAALSSKIRNTVNRTTYRYEYAGNFTNISPLPWMGAYHASILPMLFGTHNSSVSHPGQPPSTPFEYTVSHTMQDLWHAFISHPSSLPGLGWPLNLGGAVNTTDNAIELFAQQGKPQDFGWPAGPELLPQVLAGVEYAAHDEWLCPEIEALYGAYVSGDPNQLGDN